MFDSCNNENNAFIYCKTLKNYFCLWPSNNFYPYLYEYFKQCERVIRRDNPASRIVLNSLYKG